MNRVKAFLRRAAVRPLSVVTALLVGRCHRANRLRSARRAAATRRGALFWVETIKARRDQRRTGGVVNAYGAMLSGAFGDQGRIITRSSGKERDIATAIRPLTETLVATMPLIFTASPWRFVPCRHVQHRGDGQLMIGALGATITAILLAGQVPSP